MAGKDTLRQKVVESTKLLLKAVDRLESCPALVVTWPWTHTSLVYRERHALKNHVPCDPNHVTIFTDVTDRQDKKEYFWLKNPPLYKPPLWKMHFPENTPLYKTQYPRITPLSGGREGLPTTAYLHNYPRAGMAINAGELDLVLEI